MPKLGSMSDNPHPVPYPVFDMQSGTMTEPPTRADFAFRKRLDGGFTVAVRNKNVAPLTPDHFRLLTEFFPTFLTTWRELSLRLNGDFLKELMTKRRWNGSEVTPFEAIRTMDPAPYPAYTRSALKKLKNRFPALEGARVTHEWAGVMDATPDAIPVITPIHTNPGVYLASGFSGHGFGIGPGAGKLMADLLTGDTPSVDAKVFDISRLRPKYAAK